MTRRCEKKCEDEAKNLVDVTSESTEGLRLNEANVWEFRYKNRLCHLQTCYYECRVCRQCTFPQSTFQLQLIEKRCDRHEIEPAKKAIQTYYSAQNLDEWKENDKANLTALFPRLCRRFLPDELQVCWLCQEETTFQVHSHTSDCDTSMMSESGFLDCSEETVIERIRDLVSAAIHRSARQHFVVAILQFAY